MGVGVRHPAGYKSQNLVIYLCAPFFSHVAESAGNMS